MIMIIILIIYNNNHVKFANWICIVMLTVHNSDIATSNTWGPNYKMCYQFFTLHLTIIAIRDLKCNVLIAANDIYKALRSAL